MTGQQTHLPTFGLNHPKNYFGVPIAIAAEGDTGGLIMGHLVKRQLGTVRRGATELGLVNDDLELTALGTEVSEFAADEYGSHEAALDQFGEWKRKQTRFIDLNNGEWGVMAAQTLQAYEPATRIASVLQAGQGGLPLPEFIARAGKQDPTVAEMFLDPEVCEELEPLSDIDPFNPVLEEREAYRSTAICQLKAVLFHCGLLTEPGSDSGTLVPAADVWELDTETGCVPVVMEAADGERATEEGDA